MKVKRCLWDRNRRGYPVKAEIVGEVFDQLEQEFGEVTPKNFLDASRPEDSPTHKLFEWRDEKAAELYRTEQSRHVIRDLRVEIVDNDKTFTAPAFVNVHTANDGYASYQNIVHVFSCKEKRDSVLDRAYRELQMFKTKYSNFVELSRVITAIDEVLHDN